MKKVEQFTNYDVADKINKFLEEHDVEYVDIQHGVLHVLDQRLR